MREEEVEMGSKGECPAAVWHSWKKATLPIIIATIGLYAPENFQAIIPAIKQTRPCP